MPTPLMTSSAAASMLPPWCELSTNYRPLAFRVQWASCAWMQGQARALRRQVFCEEQGLFERDDTDEIDRQASTVRSLVAVSCLAGEPDEVLGTVRIHEAAPGVWWGSRLAVAPAWRQQGRLGSALIRLAVCSAHGQGCNEFLAQVQSQNVALFERLHWQALTPSNLHGRPHMLMRADLAHYPACVSPYAGFVFSGGLA